MEHLLFRKAQQQKIQKMKNFLKKVEELVLKIISLNIFSAFPISCLFVAYWIDWLVKKRNPTDKEQVTSYLVEYLDWLYIYLCIPGFCILDVFFTKKFRKPHPIMDIIVLMVLLSLFCSCEFGYQHRGKETNTFFKYLSDHLLELILRYVCCILSYFLFDFLVYIKTKESGDYYHFLSKDTSKPKEKPKIQEIPKEPKAVNSENSVKDIKSSNDEKN